MWRADRAVAPETQQDRLRRGVAADDGGCGDAGSCREPTFDGASAGDKRGGSLQVIGFAFGHDIPPELSIGLKSQTSPANFAAGASQWGIGCAIHMPR